MTVLYRPFNVIKEDKHECCKNNQMIARSETIIVKVKRDFGRGIANKKQD